MRKLLLISLCLVLMLSAAAAFAITVVVNDQTLPSSPPAIERSNRVLLPLRVVFESLGADVNWEGTTQTITATRGDTTVTMSINQPTAYINDRAVTLDVPPQLIGAYTYVPVRFPAEAFGADVRWEEVTRTVSVSLGGTVTPPPTPQPQPYPQPIPQPLPGPQGGRVTGVISAISRNSIGIMVNSELQVYRITRATVILSRDRQADTRDLLPGDEAKVEYNDAGEAISVQATYDTAEGVVVGKTSREIELDSRSQPFRVLSDIVVTNQDGSGANYADIRNGDRVVLRMTPDTYNAYGIMIRGQAGGESPLRITSDLSGTLTPGDVFRLSVTGPGGGQARFSLGDWQRDIPLVEDANRPGQYRGTFNVPDLNDTRDEFIIVTLRTGDGRQLTVRSDTPLHFASSSQPSEISLRLVSPQNNDQVGNNLVVEGYTDPNADVTITINWQALGGLGSGQVIQTRVTANNRGHFTSNPISLEVNSPIPQQAISYRLTAVARGQQGRQSAPLEVEFTQ